MIIAQEKLGLFTVRSNSLWCIKLYLWFCFMTFIVSLLMLNTMTKKIHEPLNTDADMSEREHYTYNHKGAKSGIISNKTIVLIIAYMRSGSTLTGSIFQEYQNTFYVFEPFRSFLKQFGRLRHGSAKFASLPYMFGKRRNYTVDEIDTALVAEINRWLSCDLDDLSLPSLTDNSHLKQTNIMRTFSLCSKTPFTQLSHLTNHSGYAARKIFYEIASCLGKAVNGCRGAPMIALKFIRLRMKYVISLLSLYPNMKIIHLVRDPRGMINSRIGVRGGSLNVSTSSQTRDFVRYKCETIIEDLYYSKMIMDTYKDRIKIIRYEDLAENPLETTKDMVEFVGLTFTKHMQEFITNKTSAAQDACTFCTERQNSSATANNWRTSLSAEYADFIYDSCEASNTILGYLPLAWDVLNNTAYPCRRKTNVEEELHGVWK